MFFPVFLSRRQAQLELSGVLAGHHVCFLMYHRLDTKTVNLRPHAARDVGGFRGIFLGGKGTGWELGRSAMYLDCYQMLINC